MEITKPTAETGGESAAFSFLSHVETIMNPKAISVDNLGPIAHFEFSGSKPGITVFSGPNGIGKSIFQKAIETAAKGKGPVPLRDHTKSGRVDAK